MSPKDICDVLSNNKGYYKEIFDLYGPMRLKIRAYHETKKKQAGKGKIHHKKK